MADALQALGAVAVLALASLFVLAVVLSWRDSRKGPIEVRSQRCGICGEFIDDVRNVRTVPTPGKQDPILVHKGHEFHYDDEGRLTAVNANPRRPWEERRDA